jgi:pimeloyl-ACP methyl ester carboxylesterase
MATLVDRWTLRLFVLGRRESIRSAVRRGAEDEGFPPAHAEFIGAHIGNSRLTIMEDSAHQPNLEQPEIFNAVLWAFAGG